MLRQHFTTDGADGKSYSVNLYDDGAITIDENEPTTGASVATEVDRGRWVDGRIEGCKVVDSATVAALGGGLRHKLELEAQANGGREPTDE